MFEKYMNLSLSEGGVRFLPVLNRLSDNSKSISGIYTFQEKK